MKIIFICFVIIYKMDTLKIYLASDLHIDQWDPNINNMYPLGEVKYDPVNWKNIEENSILILAGDVSDIASLSINYLNEISKHFDYVLYIDGNHEHLYSYPYLFSHQDIDFKRSVLENNKLIYLPQQDFVIRSTVIIGYCGWWDHSVKEDLDYFKDWIPKLNNEKNEKIFCENVKKRAAVEYQLLKNKIDSYDKRTDIDTIIVVTHTVPREEFARDVNTDHNSLLGNIKSEKIKYWFFGHNHRNFTFHKEGISFISHPRGRPEDYDRVGYQPLKLLLHH